MTAKRSLPTRLDRQRLEFLHQLDKESGEDLIEEIVALFERHTIEQLVELDKAVDSQAFETIKRLAHTIKGGGRELGAQRLAEICQSCEDGAKRRDAEACFFWLTEIKIEFEAVLSELRSPALAG